MATGNLWCPGPLQPADCQSLDWTLVMWSWDRFNSVPGLHKSRIKSGGSSLNKCVLISNSAQFNLLHFPTLFWMKPNFIPSPWLINNNWYCFSQYLKVLFFPSFLLQPFLSQSWCTCQSEADKLDEYKVKYDTKQQCGFLFLSARPKNRFYAAVFP